MQDDKTDTQEPINIPKNKTSRPYFWKNVGILVSGFALIVVMLVAGFAGFRLLAVNTQLAEWIAGLQKQVTQSQAIVDQAQKAVLDAQHLTQQLSDELKTQAQAITVLQQAEHSNKNDLQIAAAEYLVKIASNSLQYENDTPLALHLLQSADQNIAKINDPALYTVREALAADIAALQSAPQVDVTGLYLRLTQLSDQLDKLPVLNKFVMEQAQNKTIANEQNLSWWRRGLNATWEQLQRIIIIRKNKMTVPPFIAPEQQAFLFQNLHAEIEKAQWALLHHQSEIYRASLQQEITWIKQYVVQDSPITQQVLTSLAQLQQIDVNPVVPTVTSSVQAFQKYFSAAGK